MARRERRGAHGGANAGRGEANDSVRQLLTRTERRLRRIGQHRGTREMKRAYREAADRVRRILPK